MDSPKDNAGFRLRMEQSARSAGFTLLEMLVSLVILALMVAVIFGAFHLGVQSYERGERMVEITQERVYGWEHVSRQIQSAYPYTAQQGKIYFLGDSDAMDFVSAYSIRWGGRRGFMRVSYRVREIADDGYAFMVFEEQLLDNDRLKEDVNRDEYEVLLRTDERPVFHYFKKKAGAAEESEGTWEESWKEDSGSTPGKVAVCLGDVQPDEEGGGIFHLRIASRGSGMRAGRSSVSEVSPALEGVEGVPES